MKQKRKTREKSNHNHHDTNRDNSSTEDDEGQMAIEAALPVVPCTCILVAMYLVVRCIKKGSFPFLSFLNQC